MAGYRKLSRTSDQRKALLRNQVTALIYRGKIVTTEQKAKEVRKIAEGIIAMAVREKAVSYTHLDVYKRQGIYTALFRCCSDSDAVILDV